MASQLPSQIFSGGSSLSDGFLEAYLNNLANEINNLPGSVDSLAFTADTKNANYTGSVGEIALYNPAGGVFTIEFPPAPERDDVFAIKNQNDASDLPILLDGNGSNIEGPGDSDPSIKATTVATAIAAGGGVFGLWKYDGTVWRLVGAAKVPDVQAISINITTAEKGGSAPSLDDIGSTPLIRAFRFNNTNQTMSSFQELPPDRLARFDMLLRFFVQLRSGQTNGDTLDALLDYVVTVPESNDGGVAKASTQIAAAVTVETAKGLAAGSPYILEFVFQDDEATNPLTKGGSLGWEFKLANTAGVGDIHVLGAELIYIK